MQKLQTKIDTKSLVFKLVKCESESEVIDVLNKYGYWNDKSAWRYYGDNENNFSIIGNQQSSPDTALVEKLINSVDAVLMKKCLENGIPPESELAPKNIEDAVSKFFNVPDGNLATISAKKRTELSKQINLIATGSKKRPNFIIADLGEGQTPKKLPYTILSLNKSNKLKIPFVQGKFNMGGSGVLQFCGNNNLQLILSKRCPDISDNDETKDFWGFTIVRREPPSDGRRSSVFTYLAPNNEILYFNADELNILPSKNDVYENPMPYGTFIKLYEYNIPGLNTNILFDLYYRLSLLIPKVALPIRFYERRKGFQGHTLETTLTGLNVRLHEDKRNNIEDGFPIPADISIKGKTLKITIVAFKNGKEKNYKKKSDGIIFTINGQTHGSISNSFFKRKSVGMGAIADSLLIIVDCTNLEGIYREDLFLNSRDRLRDNDLKNEIEKELALLISNHPVLKELREKRRRESIQQQLKDDKPLADILTKVMKNSPTLSKLFIDGEKLSNPFKFKEVEQMDTKFIGKKFPTYFHISKKIENNNNVKYVPKNVRPRITFETDAENHYFNREYEPGEYILYRNGALEDSSFTFNLHNGIATLNLNLPNDSLIGDEYNYTLHVSDPSRIDPFINNFTIKVIEPTNSKQNGSGYRKKPPIDNKGNSREIPSKLSMPNIFEIYEKDWLKHGFNKESALRINNNGDSGYDFLINMDNIHLLTELKAKSNEDNINLLSNKYKYGMVLIGLSVLHYLENNHDEEDYELVEKISKMISPILLPMIENLGDLQNFD